MVSFTYQIFKNFLRQKARLRPSIQKLVRWAFEVSIENQKPDRKFEKFGQVFKTLAKVIKKFGHVFAFYAAHSVPISHGKKY